MSERMFTGFERGPDFDRARTRVATRFLSVVVDLAQTCPPEGVVYNVGGDFAYLDLSSPAALNVEFNSDVPGISPAVRLSPGTGVDALFSSLRVFWTTGTGNATLIIATGDRIRPQSAATSIVGQVSVELTGSNKSGYPGSGTIPVDLLAISAASFSVPIWVISNASEAYGQNRQLFGVREHGVPGTATSFKSTTAMAANTPETILAPAANVNGVIVFAGGAFTNGAAVGAYCPILAKTSAPTNNIDGDVLTTVMAACANVGGNMGYAQEITRPHRVAIGKGIYAISNLAEVTPYRRLSYHLLT